MPDITKMAPDRSKVTQVLEVVRIMTDASKSASNFSPSSLLQNPKWQRSK